MFILGVFLTLGWIFCFFYYDNMIPRDWMVAILISGLFTMGWGLLKGKRL
jgi:hypothetical protein